MCAVYDRKGKRLQLKMENSDMHSIQDLFSQLREKLNELKTGVDIRVDLQLDVESSLEKHLIQDLFFQLRDKLKELNTRVGVLQVPFHEICVLIM